MVLFSLVYMHLYAPLTINTYKSSSRKQQWIESVTSLSILQCNNSSRLWKAVVGEGSSRLWKAVVGEGSSRLWKAVVGEGSSRLWKAVVGEGSSRLWKAVLVEPLG